jgi:transposase
MKPVLPLPVELWEQIPPAAQAAIQAFVQHYEEQLAALQDQIADLQQRLGQNSTNSSRPPSTDGPDIKRRPPSPSSGRKRGGQRGHELQQRPLLTPDDTVICKPLTCRRCGRCLKGDDTHPLRHQVIELPHIRPEVTEYQLHRLTCPCCGISTCATLPAGIPRGGQGPRLQAALAVFAGAYRLSKRLIQSLCGDVFGIPICPGQICALEQETTKATDPVVAELRAYAKTQDANVDETGWRQQRKRAYLWVVVTTTVTVFQIARSRAAVIAQGLINSSAGQVVTSDRYKGYLWLPLSQRQLCWAHLRRDFQAMIDRQNAGSHIGADLLLYSDALFTWWHRVRDGTLKRARFRRYVADMRTDVRSLLEAGSACACAKTAGTCRDLLALEPAMWTFVETEGIGPTNNAAERALRHAVQWRKCSYGTDSETGSRFVENILSIVATCRQQQHNVLEYLTQCCVSHRTGVRPSSLPLMAQN